MKWFEILATLEKTGSSLGKQDILNVHKEQLFPVMLATLSDDVYHVTSKQILKHDDFKAKGKYNSKNLTCFLELLGILSNRKATGNRAILKVTSLLNKVSAEEAEWMLRILDKKLRIGTGIKQIEKAWGKEAVDTIRPRDFLFMKAIAERPLDSNKTYSIEPKFDGQRMAYVYDGDTDTTKAVSLEGGDYTEQFKPILQRLRATAIKNKWSHLVADSETIARDLTWNTTRKLLSKGRGVGGLTLTDKEIEARISELYIVVFDVIVNKRFDVKLLARKAWVNVVSPSVDHDSFRRCPSVRIQGNNINKYNDIKAICIRRGLEGVIAKDLDSPYVEGKKKSWWIKGKMEEDTLDVKIVGFEKGKVRSRNEGKLGALICENPDTKERFKIGAFKDKQREVFWRHRDALLGVFVEVKFQNDGVAKARFPEFVRLRLDKTKKYT